MLNGVSKFRSASASLELWHAKQFLRKIGKISEAKSTASFLLNLAISSSAKTFATVIGLKEVARNNKI